MQKYGHTPKVDTVKLVTESENEVLTVNDETYGIYYKIYNPDNQELDGWFECYNIYIRMCVVKIVV